MPTIPTPWSRFLGNSRICPSLSAMDYYFPREAAAKLHVDTRTLARWADAEIIPVLELPSGHRRYPKQAIDAIVAEELGRAS